MQSSRGDAERAGREEHGKEWDRRLGHKLYRPSKGRGKAGVRAGGAALRWPAINGHDGDGGRYWRKWRRCDVGRNGSTKP